MSRPTPPNEEQDGKRTAQEERRELPLVASEPPLPASDPELQRLRSLTLSERPASSSSVLSLANAHAAAPLPEEEADKPPSVPARPPAPPRRAAGGDAVAEMRDRFSLGDYTGALAAAESLLAAYPDHAEAKRCADNCRSVLEQMYAARIGPLDRIPHVAVPREKLQWLSIEHQAGFVLSHVDGVSSLQMIMAACGMPMLDVLRILHELVHSRVIAFR